MNFDKSVIVVTGASKGIGNCLCKLLINKNAKVIGIYNQNKIDDNRIDAYKCDISNEDEVKRFFDYVIDKYKKVDAVVNCAAISDDADIFEKSKADFMRVLDVNLGGTFLMCKYAALNMNNGVIINVSSTDGIDTYSTLSMDYAASKAGIINLTKNLATRFNNLKICSIAPNWVNTETTLSIEANYLKSEMERIGQKRLINKEDVALKIIDIIKNNNYKSGDIIRMDDNNE